MTKQLQSNSKREECSAQSRSLLSKERANLFRVILLFVSFLAIILSYYLVKSASRSMILEEGSASLLPYIWVGSALSLMVLVPLYQKLIGRVPKFKLVFATLLVIAACLCGFWLRMEEATLQEVIAFYIFVDIFSVILVEQFWALTDSVYRSREAKVWYGLIGSGGLVGGIFAGFAVTGLVGGLGLPTKDLLLVSVASLLLISIFVYGLGRSGLFENADKPSVSRFSDASWANIRDNNYLYLIAGLLLMAQLAAPLVEFQFMSLVGEKYTDQQERTVFISWMYTWVGCFALVVNLLITPLVHRYFGALGGLFLQPVLMLGGALMFIAYPVLQTAASLRVVDRGLSYSITRASRELLYVPVAADTLQRAKAWIDMLGYRLFKVLGSVPIILYASHAKGNSTVLVELSIFLIVLSLGWMLAIHMIKEKYQEAQAIEGNLDRSVAGVG